MGQIEWPMAKRVVDWPGGLIVFNVQADATSRSPQPSYPVERADLCWRGKLSADVGRC
jgi:hypothetical protein